MYFASDLNPCEILRFCGGVSGTNWYIIPALHKTLLITGIHKDVEKQWVSYILNMKYWEATNPNFLLLENSGIMPMQCTGPLNPKVASKNPWMWDYMQKKGLDKGLNLVYVATIFIGGNINLMSFTIYNWNSPTYLSFGLNCISFLRVYGLKIFNMYKKEIQNSQSDKYFGAFQL